MKLLLALFFSFILFTHEVHGIRKTLSREEDLELDEQLRLLNKPAIKTIKTEHGDIFDCVDVYKQPAFDHPLLKNHKIQLKPSFFLKEEGQKSSASNEVKIGLKDGGCPQGTVPIKRTEKDDLIRSKSFLKRYRNNANNIAHFAISRLSGGSYHGAQANIGVYNPSVEYGQASQGAIWLSNGTPDIVNVIHVGWAVDPQIFNDNRTRFFTYWTGDGYQKSGCYNVVCPGFVQVNPSIPLGLVLETSTYQGQQYHYKVVVQQETGNLNWWLITGDDKKPVGYWPGILFPTLSQSAQAIDWGGAAYHFEQEQISPPMGSGHFPSEGFGGACFISEAQVTFDGQTFVDPGTSLDKLVDKLSMYDVGDKAQGIGEYGYAFLFGGPGGIE